ncbi:MAG: winged helix-turn-helix domain-containing protein [Candidatus Andersenbacteria bacterium]
MANQPFPLEKIFGSRTRVKIITLFTTGVKRPYFVREISRTVNERLNAVRRELEILEKIGMLKTYDERRRKYYVVDEGFALYEELASIMKKAGPGVEDVLFKHIENVGDVQYACVTGYFTSAHGAPTDLFIVGNISEQRLDMFAKRIEQQINREISYTPMTMNELQYRLNFSDTFLRQIFSGPYKELVNKLPREMQPEEVFSTKSPNIVRDSIPSA